MRAVEAGYRTIVDLLLSRGADPNRTDSFGATALHYAASRGRTEIVGELLKKGASPGVLTPPIRRIGQLNPPSDWPMFSTNGATPLHLAANRGNEAIVSMLLQAGVPVNATNYDGFAPLHASSLGARTNVCELLIGKGASVNARTARGETPLMIAVRNGYADVTRLLIEHGADVNLRITDEDLLPTALFAAIRVPKVLPLVLKAKPDLEATNGSGRTALHDAFIFNLGKSAQLALIEAGADPNRAFNGITPLIAAVMDSPDPATVEALLRHGANPNVLNANRESPLSWVENTLKGTGQRTGDSQVLARLEKIKELLASHAASGYLDRLFAIDYTRPAWSRPPQRVFSRGTLLDNIDHVSSLDYNRYTLFELVAAVFMGAGVPPFPDFAHVTLERIPGTNAKPKQVTLDLAQILESNDCTRNMWLEWGDRLSIPEVDHPVNENWSGLSGETRRFLERCLTRHVSIVVKQETNVVKLMPTMSFANPGLPFALPPGRLPEKANERKNPEKVVGTCRLKEVVYWSNVLRASSDPTRVRVTRIEAIGGKTNQWEIDLTKVRTANEPVNGPPAMAGSIGFAPGGKVPPQYDLWLRDGDVIQIPEK